jgi:hypothetical protein
LGTIKGKSFNKGEKMQELFNEVVKLLNQLIRSSKDAMALCQTWAYNGHKRYYQMKVLCYTEKLLHLKKKVYDTFRFMPADDSMSEPYKAQTYKEHFSRWENFLKTSIEKLTDLNKNLFVETGIENCIITDILYSLYKDHERTFRQIKQYNESGWNPIELHADDLRLHKKLKRKMKKEGIK